MNFKLVLNLYDLPGRNKAALNSGLVHTETVYPKQYLSTTITMSITLFVISKKKKKKNHKCGVNYTSTNK